MKRRRRRERERKEEEKMMQSEKGSEGDHSRGGGEKQCVEIGKCPMSPLPQVFHSCDRWITERALVVDWWLGMSGREEREVASTCGGGRDRKQAQRNGSV